MWQQQFVPFLSTVNSAVIYKVADVPLLTFFIQRLQTFLFLSHFIRFFILISTFLTSMLVVVPWRRASGSGLLLDFCGRSQHVE